MYLLLIIFLAVISYFIFFISQSYNIFFKGYAPFISTGTEAIEEMLDEVEIKDGATIYELGCGRTRFLKVAEKKHLGSEYIGIENLFSIYLINKIKLKFHLSTIKLLRKDFFQIDLKNADLIYCYLNNETMKRLGDKFRQECKEGTQIISQRFPIPQFDLEKVKVIKNKKVYFYKI